MSKISARRARKLRPIAQAYLRCRIAAQLDIIRARTGMEAQSLTLLQYAGEPLHLPELIERAWAPARRIIDRETAEHEARNSQ